MFQQENKSKFPKRMLGLMMALSVVVILAAFQHGLFAQANKSLTYRTYTAPDLGYSFEYPLEYYSVRNNGTCFAPEGGKDILFPGIINLEPNDKFIYADGVDTAYRIMIAGIPTEEKLSPEMMGDGPMMHFPQEMAEDASVESIDINGVPAFLTTVPTGPSGVLTQIVAIHENVRYEILIEPVAFNDTEAIDGKAIINAVMTTFKFAE